MKKILILLLSLAMAFGLMACGQDEPEAEAETPAQEQGEVLTYTNDYGFTFEYDTAKFDIEQATASAVFWLKDRKDNGELPAYVGVSVHENGVLADIEEGLSIQSGTDDVTVDDTQIGADGVDARLITYSQNIELGDQLFVFYLVELEGAGVIQIEICTAAEETQEVNAAIEELMGTFKLE